MTWDFNNFITLSRYHEGGIVTFGVDLKGKIGIGNIKIGASLIIENIVLVEGLKPNLWSISQLCDKDFKVDFDDLTCDILEKKTNICVLSGFVKTMFTWLIC